MTPGRGALTPIATPPGDVWEGWAAIPGQSTVDGLGAFAAAARFEDRSAAAVLALETRILRETRILDAFGCPAGALDAEPTRAIPDHVRGTSSLFGRILTSTHR